MKGIKTEILVVLGMAAVCGLGQEIIPRTDFRYNEAYRLKSSAGHYGWFAGVDRHNGEEIMFQLGLTDKLAMFGADPFKVPNNLERPELYEYRLKLFREGKLPLTGPNQPFYGRWPAPPTSEKIRELAEYKNFLGYRPFNEWGTGLDRMINAAFRNLTINTVAGKGVAERGKELFKDFKSEPKTREEFEEMAAHAWNTINSPYQFEVYVLDGSHYWAKAWPGGWNKIRGIFTENRVPYRSNTIMQAITRGAARMWGVPYGYLSAYDWYARIGHPIYSHMQKPRLSYQKEQGLLKINPNMYRRMWYYMVMGNTAILADESDHSQFSDYLGSGQYRLSWYGELNAEVREFIEQNPDLGVQWNPVALALSWHNGVVYRGDKAFNRFPYNNGEHMARELLHRVIYNYSENKMPMDELGPTPYGDIFDIVRLDTPRGPLSMELLENYKVLFLVGEQNFTQEVITRIKEYVENGGTVIINNAQMNGEFDSNFLGAEISGKTAQTDTVISALDGKSMKSGTFTYSPLRPEKDTTVLYKTIDGDALVTRAPFGKGYVICVGPQWLLEDRSYMENNSVRHTMLPLAGEILRNLMPALLPFRLEGENVSNRVLWQVNRKGQGWVVAMSNSAGLIPEGKAYHGYMGPDIVDINKAVTVKLVLPPELKYAVELTGHEKYYPVTKKDESFLSIPLAPGELKIIELQNVPISDTMVVRPKNLALCKKVTASSATPKYGPEKAVDGSADFMSAWWSKDACPQWLMVDLGQIETVNSIRTIPAWSEDNFIFPRITRYTVEASADGKEWKTVVDESRNIQPDTARGLQRFFKPVKARYVRLNVLFATSRQAAQIVEFEVFGDKTGQVILPWKLDPSKSFFPSEVLKMRTRLWLSDRPLEMLSAKQDEKTLAYDRECYNGGILQIRGQEFDKGLGIHAKSEIVYRLNPADGWKLFTAYVGIDDCSTPVGTVDFQIWVDGKIVARSGKITMKNQPVPIWANLIGAKELKLVVDDCADGIYGDIADWAEACIRK